MMRVGTRAVYFAFGLAPGFGVEDLAREYGYIVQPVVGGAPFAKHLANKARAS
jgi:hypothetical protein